MLYPIETTGEPKPVLLGLLSPSPISPVESMRSLSLPPVSTVTVSAPENQIAVSVSPV